jgi:hypothetical protein
LATRRDSTSRVRKASSADALAGWRDPLRFLSPFWRFGQSPLHNGVDPWGILAVLAAALVTLIAGAILAERRDLQTP